jgi:hypothetical protein
VGVKEAMTADIVDIIASGRALYALLAVFPALAAAVSIYGTVCVRSRYEKSRVIFHAVRARSNSKAPLTDRIRWEATFDEPVRRYYRPVERRTNAPISQAIPPTASSVGT